MSLFWQGLQADMGSFETEFKRHLSDNDGGR